ncbi:MAG: cache domain-containing protein [Undibacterium sp.]|uniref:cache domain-containing protein n=1 Tax=Undibacterium sp. TaxID=1914977 RepID=UPI002725E05E|nr:cache domain-containing protein [Undibacterium sp.]MDO8650742.1 cache domain-containing protein [Undibacterium sp.]
MQKFLKIFSFAIFSFILSNSAFAADHGTAEEAQALVKKAISYIKANGLEKANAEFSNPKGTFVDRDLYIYVTDMNGKALAHGANAKLIGKDLRTLRDVDDKAFLIEILAIANSKGHGWVDYKWPNPASKDKQIVQKSTYFEKFGDVVVACGIYK